MLELAVARADGDTSRPPEIDRYAARSAAEKKARLTGRSIRCSRRRARWVLPIARAADPRRLGRRRRRPHRRRRRPADPPRSTAPSATARPLDLGARRHPARPRQRAHASRAVVDARAGAAGDVDAARGRRALIALRRSTGPRADTVAADRDGDRRSARGGHGAGRRRHATRWPPTPLLRERGCRRRVFRELLGFSVADPDARSSRRAGAARRADADRPAACASRRAARAVLGVAGAAAARSRERRGDAPIEHPPRRVAARRCEFLRTAAARGATLLERSGAWNPTRGQPPGCGPVEYLDRLGLLNDRLLAVHGVQLTDAELARLAARRRDAW